MEIVIQNMNIVKEFQRMKFENRYCIYIEKYQGKYEEFNLTKISGRIQIKLKTTKSSKMEILKT